MLHSAKSIIHIPTGTEKLFALAIFYKIMFQWVAITVLYETFHNTVSEIIKIWECIILENSLKTRLFLEFPYRIF